MKKTIILLNLLCFSLGYSFATKHIISTVSTSFSPAITTANVGDTIEFVLVDVHTATQVDQNAWETNANTPLAGGFNFSAGTNLYILKSSDIGTIYFVCTPHASIGMKGIINVQNTVNINNPINTVSEVKAFPNPVKEGRNILIELPNAVPTKVKISNQDGKVVFSKEFINSDLSIPATFGRGIYLLQVTHEDKIFTKKVIVK